MARRRAALAAAIVLAAGAARGGDHASITVLEEPRAYGHFVGDVLDRRFEIGVPPAYAPVLRDLETPRRIGDLLELEEVSVQPMPGEEAPGRAGMRYRVGLRYQIIGSPEQPLVATLPAQDLRFVGPGGALHVQIEEWPVAIGPLSPGVLRVGLEALRPARVPPLLDAGPVRRRMLIECGTGLLLLAALALRRFALPWRERRHGPFASARRTVRALARLPPGDAHRRAAFRAVHRAFDETLGRRVFLEHLDDFMAQRPQFEALRGSAAHFFAESRREFFGGPAAISCEGAAAASPAALQLDWLVDLCAAFGARERGRMRASTTGHVAVL